ncbi:GNAT family N-acetyltransferase [bacterium]|nr:GNAT family N-acetyltransferase [bacterium]
MGLSKPEPIRVSHLSVDFDCGNPGLNLYLQRFALTNHQQGAARTFVTCEEMKVLGYYSLAAASASLDEVPTRVAKGLPRHPAPLILLGRLAVDSSQKNRGVGKGLLRDAFLRYMQAQELIGCRALLTHAKDERAAEFYRHFGFEPCGFSPLHLYLMTKDLQRNL